VVLFARQIVGVAYNRETRTAVQEAIAGSQPEGGTPLFDAIEAAVTRLDKQIGRRVVVVLTDGDDCGSRLRPEGLLRFLRSSDATVHLIDFSRRVPPDGLHLPTEVTDCTTSPRLLFEVAEITGGKVYHAGGAEDVAGILEHILADLRSQYVLGYVSDAPTQDGRYRKLEVRSKRRGLDMRHKTGYTAKGGKP
jgi:Ca-activated chloride channel homolog